MSVDHLSRRGQLETVLHLIEEVGPGDPAIDQARKLIADNGIDPKMHVGDDPGSFDADKTYEWLLGQIASIIDEKGWFAMNSLINVAITELEKYPA